LWDHACRGCGGLGHRTDAEQAILIQVAWEFFESTCNTNLPLSIQPTLPSAESTVQGTWDMLGRPCQANAAGQLVIERLSNGQVRKIFWAVE